SGISGDPPGGALAQVPVLHRGPAAQRHPGNQCSVAHSARVGFRAAAAAGTVAERRTGTPRGAATVTTLLHRLVAAAGTLLACLPSTVPAQTAGPIPESAYAALRWRLIGPHRGGRVLAVAGVPGDPATFYFGAVDGGVCRSTDGGRTWTKVLYKNPDTGAIDLAADPGDPQVVYAALWQARRTPWEQYQPDEGPGSGLYKSSDGGLTWAPLAGHGLPAGPLGRIGLAVARGGRVYALIGAAQGAGLYRSDDGGTTWLLAGADPRLTSRNWYFCR